MRPEERDPAHLWDMLEHARLAVEITDGLSFAEYAADRVRQLALERVLEIIGEAARRVSDSFRNAHSEIPWSPIIAHRNILAHEYDEVRQERLWGTVKEQIPILVSMLEPLVPPTPDNGDYQMQQQ